MVFSCILSDIMQESIKITSKKNIEDLRTNVKKNKEFKRKRKKQNDFEERQEQLLEKEEESLN